MPLNTHPGFRPAVKRALLALALSASPAGAQGEPATLLIGLGDSLGHGTMDAANNQTNTENAFLQFTADSLSTVVELRFSQPYFDDDQERISPREIPTNLSVDGADSFSAEGIEYYKGSGASESLPNPDYFCDARYAGELESKYDKVFFPLNKVAGQTVSMLDAAEELMARNAASATPSRVLIVHWLGNNDSSSAALGQGGVSPGFLPIPFEQSKDELSPALRLLLSASEAAGELSFEPYTAAGVDRGLTELVDFEAQFDRLLDRLAAAPAGAGKDIFVSTLPYYSAVGYLFDSEDLEFYLQKLNPAYTVPPSFKRVAPAGEPVSEPLSGDRVSLLTFGFLYALLATGSSIEEVNSALEVDGVQADGLVLSEAEAQTIVTRIDGFNTLIGAAVAARGAEFHLVDLGGFINAGFTGETPIVIDGQTLTRNWGRGDAFSLDGVHPGYSAQAVLANQLLEEINAGLGIAAPALDTGAIRSGDPYVDVDGDGWVPGPDYAPESLTELLFLFRDPDDSDPEVQVLLPENVWEIISRVLLKDLLGIEGVRREAERLGLAG